MFNWLRKNQTNKPRVFEETIAKEVASASIAQTETQRLSALHKNRGDECIREGALDQAAEYYRQAIAVHPKFAEAYHGLGDTLKEQGKLDEAIPCYRSALEFAPGLKNTHFSLGVALLEKSDLHGATACFERALKLKPDFARAHNSLGFILLELGKPAEALACFQKAISVEPANGMALHLIASLTGSNPERAPSQYVEKLFDGFADTFDAQLQLLKYETPKHLVDLIANRSAPAAGKWHVLDLGCGTGLVGLVIAPYASQLVGVDLSAKMLVKAQALNLYHRLECLDMMTMMQAEKSSSYDIVIAADSFIYLGKLDGVMKEAKRLLHPGGYFAFSVESLDALPDAALSHGVQPEYLLQKNPSCRYAHSSGYISKLASDNDFKIHDLTTAHIRMSSGNSVNGYLVLLES